jgi:hypothetical protein
MLKYSQNAEESTNGISGSDNTGIKYKSAPVQGATYRVHVNRCSETPPEQT